MGTKLAQTNMTSGVLDPLLAAREDITFFYNGLEDALNGLALPQGGMSRRPGKQHVRELTRVLSTISLSGATVTAPNGGTTGNLKDGNDTSYLTTSVNLSSTNNFVIAHIDLGSAQDIDAIDIINYKLTTGALSNEIRVQTSLNNSAFSDYGTPFDWDVTDRTRRQRNASGTVSARYIHVIRVGTTNLAANASIGEIRIWTETSDLSNARLISFAFSTEEAYMQVLSDRNIDTLIGDDYAGSISIPHTSAQLPIVNRNQNKDTLILYHPRVQPWRIFRQGGDEEFDSRAVVFENIPEYDYGAGVGGTDEIQVLNVAGASSGDKFTILLDDERTTTISVGANDAATATNIETALRALNNTSAAGITVADATDGFTVTFGGDDGKKPWPEIKVSVLSGNGVWDTARTTKGKDPGEPVMSDTRGWPRCGVFAPDGHYMGGIPELPDAMLRSVTGEPYNLNTELDASTAGLMLRAETDQVGAIYQIVSGRDVTLFCNDGEFYFEPGTSNTSPVLRLATRTGSKEGLPVYEVDGALHFLQGVKDDESDRETVTSVREFLFVDTVQSYEAGLLSKLSGHLIKNPVDYAVRKATSAREADVELLINEDGSGTAYTVLRNDAVNAFVPFNTKPFTENASLHKLLATGVDKKRRVYFIVERTINGIARRFIERWNENLILDGGDIVTVTAETFTATDGQDTFTWTFDNPVEVDAIGVRKNGFRIDDGFTVDLGTKTVVLDEPCAAGDVIRIAKMIDEITGIDYLAGETVQLIVDGSKDEDVTVSGGGVITLADYADTEVQFGFDFYFSGKFMPPRIPGSETLAGRKMRTVRAILSLFETGNIEIRANGGRWQKIDLQKLDNDILDRSISDLLFTGEVQKRGLLGWNDPGAFEWRSSGAKCTVRAVVREIAI